MNEVFILTIILFLGILLVFKTKPNQGQVEKTKLTDSSPDRREFYSNYLREYNSEYQQAIAENDKVKMKLLEDERLKSDPTAEEMRDSETFKENYKSIQNRRDAARRETILHSVDINRYTPKQYLRLVPQSDYCGDIFYTKSLEDSLTERGLWPTDEELPTKKLFDDLSELYLSSIFNVWYKGSYENKTDHWQQFREECFFEFCKENKIQTNSKKLNDRIKKGAKFYAAPKSKYKFDVPGIVFIYSTLKEAPENKFKLGALERKSRTDADNFVKNELKAVGKPIIVHSIKVKKCAHEIINQLAKQLEPNLSGIREPADTSNIQIRVLLNWYHIDLDELEKRLRMVIDEFNSE